MTGEQLTEILKARAAWLAGAPGRVRANLREANLSEGLLMKRWSVSIPWHAALIVRVAATTEAEAIEKATKGAWPSLCHHCAGNVELCEMDESSKPEAIEVEK